MAKKGSEKPLTEETPRVVVNKKSKKQLEKEIIEFLNESSTRPVKGTKPRDILKHGLACVLATVKDNVPRATPVDFFNDGPTIWVIADPGKKLSNIRSNPQVAVGIYYPMDHSKLNRSLQIQGKAKLVNYKDHRKVFMSMAKRLGILTIVGMLAEEHIQKGDFKQARKDEWVEKTLRRFNLIRIDPDEITFLCVYPNKGSEKDIWKRNTLS